MTPRVQADALLKDAEDAKKPKTWCCQNCTFVNSIFEKTCAMCEMGWTGKREVR